MIARMQVADRRRAVAEEMAAAEDAPGVVADTQRAA